MKFFFWLAFFYSSSVFAKTTWYPGVVLPTSSEKVLAPQNVLKMRDSSCSSSNVVLKELKDDGTQVKAGETVCAFEYICAHFFNSIERYIREMQAVLDENKQKWQASKEELKAQLSFAKIAVNQAEISFKKAKLLAKKDQSLAKIDLEIASQKHLTQEKLLQAETKKALAEENYHQGRLSEALQDQVRFNIYKARYKVLAEGPFVVRHMQNKNLKRKIKKGDHFMSGTPMLFLARDKRLSVEFYVDEDRFSSLKAGRSLQIESDGKLYPAKIKSISPFPQTLGFLMNDQMRADASDKAYTVYADLDKNINLQAGVDVRVSLL